MRKVSMKNVCRGHAFRIAFGAAMLALLLTIGVVSTQAMTWFWKGPIMNPANGHQYYAVIGSSWTDAEAMAQFHGGHLVTINDDAENRWVWETFAPLVGGPLWIGLSDAAQEGTFVWASGEPATYFNWWCRSATDCEPNNLNGVEDYVEMNNYVWNDNVNTAGFVGIVEVAVDKTAPVTTDDSPSAWQKTDFTVTLTCTDTGGSSCKETKYSIDGGTLQVGNSIIISTEGDHLIEYYSVDGAGNQESTKSTRAKLDKTLPIISFSGLATVNLASVANVIVAVTDSISGVAYQSAPDGANTLDTSTVGTKPFMVTAQDIAGNEAISTYTYNVIYDFLGAGGFQPPISNTATNTGKAGSVVPVKWQLPDGKGGFISDPNVVLPFTYRLGSCSLSTSEFTADTSGNTGLRYDTTTNQYIYNWKTPNTAGCYVLVLKLNDGSEYTANFALR
jgi:hypothetical protein